MAGESLDDGLLRRTAIGVAEGGQHLWVTLSGDDGADDLHSGLAGDVGEDVVELEVHLGEGLLHMEDVGCAVLDELGAVAQEGAQGAHLGIGAEGGVEQSEGVELADPLAVGDVRLAAGDILDVGAVDQVDLEAASLQQLEDWNPVDAGGFHRHGLHTAFLEPIGEGFQVRGEGGETAHRVTGQVGADGGPDFAAADVETGGVGVDEGHRFERVGWVHHNLHSEILCSANRPHETQGRLLIGVTPGRAASGEITPGAGPRS